MVITKDSPINSPRLLVGAILWLFVNTLGYVLLR